MSVFNYTGCERIDGSLVSVKVEKASEFDPIKVYLRTKPEFRENPRFKDCSLVMEAYLRTKSQRVELGPVADLRPSVERTFSNFLYSDGVQFKLKVVHPEDKMLVGVLEGLKEKCEKKPELTKVGRKDIIWTDWAQPGEGMDNRPWSVSFEGPKPTLLLKRGAFGLLSDVLKPEFQALVYPAIVKEVLNYAFVSRFSDPPSWAQDWEMLAEIIGAEERPTFDEDETDLTAIAEYMEETRAWIDKVAEKFGERNNLGAVALNGKGGK